jgi:hypothetical protein
MYFIKAYVLIYSYSYVHKVPKNTVLNVIVNTLCRFLFLRFDYSYTLSTLNKCFCKLLCMDLVYVLLLNGDQLKVVVL